jgi:hypothetical protein
VQDRRSQSDANEARDHRGRASPIARAGDCRYQAPSNVVLAGRALRIPQRGPRWAANHPGSPVASGQLRTTTPQVRPAVRRWRDPLGLAYNDEVTPELPRRVRGLPTRSLVTRDGPHPTVERGSQRHSPYRGRLTGRATSPAIHSSPCRCPADNHGQHHSGHGSDSRTPGRSLADLAFGSGRSVG